MRSSVIEQQKRRYEILSPPVEQVHVGSGEALDCLTTVREDFKALLQWLGDWTIDVQDVKEGVNVFRNIWVRIG